MEKERLVEIKVFGQAYTVKSDAEEDHVQEVARFVNQKMEEVLQKTRSVSTLNVAILTALNIADDLLREKKRSRDLFHEVEMKSKDLAERIEFDLSNENVREISIVRYCQSSQGGDPETHEKE
jgi:cell division protein ZapA